MITSRELCDLHPYVRSCVVTAIARAKMLVGCDVLVTCTYRDEEAQDALYAEGRTAPGRIVTNAKAGESYHNWQLAVDIVPLRNGKPVWDANDPVWAKVAEIFKQQGFEWGGDWVHFRELPHFQMTGGCTIKDLQNGLEPSFVSE